MSNIVVNVLVIDTVATFAQEAASKYLWRKQSKAMGWNFGYEVGASRSRP